MEGGQRVFKALTRAYELFIGSFILRRTDHLTAVSNVVAEHARRIGAGSKSITVIPNGVDTEIFTLRRTKRGMEPALPFFLWDAWFPIKALTLLLDASLGFLKGILKLGF